MSDDPVSRMFAWWNRAFAENRLEVAAFAEHYSEDCILRVNGALRANGLEALARHFAKIRAEVEAAAAQLPLTHCYRSGDRMLVHYRIDATLDGNTVTEQALGHVRLQDDKIAVIDVWSWD